MFSRRWGAFFADTAGKDDGVDSVESGNIASDALSDLIELHIAGKNGFSSPSAQALVKSRRRCIFRKCRARRFFVKKVGHILGGNVFLFGHEGNDRRIEVPLRVLIMNPSRE